MSRSSSRVVLAVVRAVLLTSVLTAPVHAQRWSDLIPVGERIRVRTQKQDEEYVGLFKPSPNDTLNILPDAGGLYVAPTTIPLPSVYVKAVDVSQGPSRMVHGLLGFILGGVTGGIVGAVVGNHLDSNCQVGRPTNPVVGQCYTEGGEQHLGMAILGVFGAGAGAVLGGILGAASAPENWRNVYNDRGPAPSP